MAKYKFNPTKKESIYWYKDSKGNKKYAFRYKYYNVLNKRKEKTGQGFNSEIEAERALINVKAEILDGGEKYVENDGLTVEKWFTIWFESRTTVLRSGTQELYQRLYKDHIHPAIGKMRLNKLTTMYLQRELVNPLLNKNYARNTIKQIVALVKAFLNSAIKEGIIKSNPMTNIDYSKATNKKADNYLDIEDLERLLQCAYNYDSTTYYTALLTLAYTGMRKGELAGLRWSDIDFENGTITIERSRNGKKLGPPKSDNGYRTFEVHQELIDQLKKYNEWCNEVKTARGEVVDIDDYVFINRYSYKPIGSTYLNEVLYAIYETYKDLPKITPHGLRHTFSSFLISKKTPLITVAKTIGDHPMTVSNVYSHSFKEAEKNVVNLFNDIQPR